MSFADLSLIPRDVGSDPDDWSAPFHLLRDGRASNLAGALLTITGVVGGGPRALGTQMAVLEDGSYCGHLSGGCIEAAAAVEAIEAIRSGQNATFRFGLGSPFIDIQLPCGGGIDIHVEVDPDESLIHEAIAFVNRRLPFKLCLGMDSAAATLKVASMPADRSGWVGRTFERHYHPRTKVVVIGEGYELTALLNAARALKFDTSVHVTSQERMSHADALAALSKLEIDEYTAVVLVMHSREQELAVLEQVLAHDAFYIGAVGSKRTHTERLRKASALGIPDHRLTAIRGPVGLFGPTRHAAPLAISILAEIAQTRLQMDGQV